MRSKKRILLGALAVFASAFLAHALLYLMTAVGLPSDYVRRPGGMWPAGSAGRFLLYAGVGVLQAFLWRRLTGARFAWTGAVAVLAACGWVYWFVLQPNALLTLLSPDVSLRWMNLVRHVPILGDIYAGWGFGRHLSFLVAGQGVMAMLVLAGATVLNSRRAPATVPRPA